MNNICQKEYLYLIPRIVDWRVTDFISILHRKELKKKSKGFPPLRRNDIFYHNDGGLVGWMSSV